MQKGRIWLPKDSHFIPTIITEFHDTPTGGHLGISKTMARIGENFTWTSMKKDVHLYISTCLICQQTKNVHQKRAGLLFPLPISARPWEDLSLDFIGVYLQVAAIQQCWSSSTVFQRGSTSGLSLHNTQPSKLLNCSWKSAARFTVHLAALSPTETPYSLVASGGNCSSSVARHSR